MRETIYIILVEIYHLKAFNTINFDKSTLEKVQWNKLG